MDEIQPLSSNWASRLRRYGAAGTLVAGGVLAGGLLAGSFSANAATSTPSSTTPPTSGYAQPGSGLGDSTDQSQPQRSDEQLLTGTTLEQVTAAVLAAYPDATIVRAETDSEGVYEAHITLADGQPAIVQVGADFTVTGTQTGGPGGRAGPCAPESDGSSG